MSVSPQEEFDGEGEEEEDADEVCPPLNMFTCKFVDSTLELAYKKWALGRMGISVTEQQQVSEVDIELEDYTSRKTSSNKNVTTLSARLSSIDSMQMLAKEVSQQAQEKAILGVESKRWVLINAMSFGVGLFTVIIKSLFLYLLAVRDDSDSEESSFEKEELTAQAVTAAWYLFTNYV